MKKIYFTRHGQTFWNVENKICGATDIELTEYGKEQARKLGNMIKTKIDSGELHIDMIISSPLSRAFDTSAIVSEITGIPMKSDDRVKEQNFGKYEGTARDGLEFKASKRNFIDSYEGGENMLKLAQRIYNILDELKEDDNIYLIVAHNGIARSVNSYFSDMSNEAYGDFGIKNCELKTYEYI